MKLNPDAVPGSYAAAVVAFRSSLSPDDVKALLSYKSANDALLNAHHNGGRVIRNEWSLWESDTPIARDMRSKGLFHADDISSAIILGAICEMFGEKFDFDSHVRKCREHWLSMNIDPDTGAKL